MLLPLFSKLASYAVDSSRQPSAFVHISHCSLLFNAMATDWCVRSLGTLEVGWTSDLFDKVQHEFSMMTSAMMSDGAWCHGTMGTLELSIGGATANMVMTSVPIPFTEKSRPGPESNPSRYAIGFMHSVGLVFSDAVSELHSKGQCLGHGGLCSMAFNLTSSGRSVVHFAMSIPPPFPRLYDSVQLDLAQNQPNVHAAPGANAKEEDQEPGPDQKRNDKVKEEQNEDITKEGTEVTAQMTEGGDGRNADVGDDGKSSDQMDSGSEMSDGSRLLEMIGTAEAAGELDISLSPQLSPTSPYNK